jgi:hypothetical protein
MECPADTGRWSLPAALCAQHVPKFRLLRCPASTLNTAAVPPSPWSYQCRGVQSDISYGVARARQWFRAFVAMHIVWMLWLGT